MTTDQCVYATNMSTQLASILNSVSASTVHSSHSTSSLSVTPSAFTTLPLSSYLPSFSFTLYGKHQPSITMTTATTTITPFPSFLDPSRESHFTRSSYQTSHPTIANLTGSTGLFNLVASTARLSTSLEYITTVYTLLENQTETEKSPGASAYSSSIFDSLNVSLYLSLNRGILMAILLGTISLFTIVGNLMVIWAIFNYRPLHNVQNMYLVSLAVADILVAVLVMPFNVVYNLLDKWIFGLHLCEMWLTSDV